MDGGGIVHSNASNSTSSGEVKCLTEAQMQMHGSEFERYLQRYLFLGLVLFGIFGNSLNLTVLLNPKMQSRANTFLAMLAFADIVFLSLLMPNVLANYSLFSSVALFRLLYFNAKVHLRSIANWASAVAIWCVIAVCTDRLIGIRNPLFARGYVSRRKMALLMGSILTVPALLTAHQHFSHECLVRFFCNGTQIQSICLPVTQEQWLPNKPNPYSLSFRRFISVSTLINTVISVIFPIILLTVLNFLLLCALRRRKQELDNIGSKQIKPSKSTSSEGFSQQIVHSKTEQRVTWTVTLIVSMFTLTNGPSAVVNLIEGFAIAPPAEPKTWYNLTLIASTLVILGKVSNFILFCLSSKHFRRRLFVLAQKRVHGRLASFPDRRRSSYTAMSSATRKGTPNKSSVVGGGGGDTRRTSQVPMAMAQAEETADGERLPEGTNTPPKTAEQLQ
uniref:G-protein coupled receptors family 1 profile domain-containing protein n=1 Tax=Globodera rostochiensis TaxID=31243 RepID=A0A914HHJ8_GLORO